MSSAATVRILMASAGVACAVPSRAAHALCAARMSCVACARMGTGLLSSCYFCLQLCMTRLPCPLGRVRVSQFGLVREVLACLPLTSKLCFTATHERWPRPPHAPSDLVMGIIARVTCATSSAAAPPAGCWRIQAGSSAKQSSSSANSTSALSSMSAQLAPLLSGLISYQHKEGRASADDSIQHTVLATF